MIYRALNDQDIIRKKIESKVKVNNFQEALKQVNSHILNGSKTSTCWISATKSFEIAVDNYLLPSSFSNNNGRYMALIKNCDESQIINCKDCNILNYNIDLVKNHQDFINMQVKKVVLDISTKKNNSKYLKNNILLETKGTILKKYFVGLCYATRSKEVLIYDHIDDNDLLTILNSFQIDIFYALPKLLDLSDDEIIKITKLIDLNIDNLNLSDMEKTIFNEHYLNHKSMDIISEEIIKCNPNVDVLEIYDYLKKVKKNIIAKTIKFYFGCDICPSIPEDKLYIVRLGKFNKKKFQFFTYKGINSVVTHAPITMKKGEYDDTRRVILVANYSNGEMKEKNIFWIENGIILQKKFKGNKNIESTENIKTYRVG